MEFFRIVKDVSVKASPKKANQKNQHGQLLLIHTNWRPSEKNECLRPTCLLHCPSTNSIIFSILITTPLNAILVNQVSPFDSPVNTIDKSAFQVYCTRIYWVDWLCGKAPNQLQFMGDTSCRNLMRFSHRYANYRKCITVGLLTPLIEYGDKIKI